MKKKILMPVVALALGAMACAVPGMPGGDGSLFRDDFSSSDSGWGVGTDSDSSIEYSGGELVGQVYVPDFYVWSIPGEDVENVHIEVTAKNTGGFGDTAFGIICHHQVTDSYYYFAITSAGDYAIAKTALAQDDLFLTNDDQWATSDSIPVDAASYQIGADCANGTLTLYVNGAQIASVTDSTYTSGDVGLFVWSGSNANAEVRYDDFVVTEFGAAASE
jgi:hypothetical protein